VLGWSSQWRLLSVIPLVSFRLGEVGCVVELIHLSLVWFQVDVDYVTTHTRIYTHTRRWNRACRGRNSGSGRFRCVSVCVCVCVCVRVWFVFFVKKVRR
jgi:hypothetical protein